jgi:hypothetical protein
MLLYKPGALRKEAAVFARGAFTDEKMLMRLAAIPPSAEYVRVGQAEGVNIARQLFAFRSWDGVLCG